jgi:OOP family OmpA-OmpF porin
MEHHRLRATAQLLMALAAAAGLATRGALAEGLYAGASLGSPHYADRIDGLSGNGSGLAGKLFGGYQWSPNFGLEAGFADLGHIDHQDARVDGDAAFVDAVGSWPLTGQWSLLGRVGVARVDLNTSAGDDSGTGLKFGLGAQYDLTPSVSLRGEWERYRPAVFGEHTNIDAYTLGVRIGF